MIKKRTTDKAEVGEKRKADGFLGNNNNNNKFSKLSNKHGSNQEGKWCNQFKKRHFGNYVVCYKCKKPRHISTNCPVKRKCFLHFHGRREHEGGVPKY